MRTRPARASPNLALCRPVTVLEISGPAFVSRWRVEEQAFHLSVGYVDVSHIQWILGHDRFVYTTPLQYCI